MPRSKRELISFNTDRRVIRRDDHGSPKERVDGGRSIFQDLRRMARAVSRSGINRAIRGAVMPSRVAAFWRTLDNVWHELRTVNCTVESRFRVTRWNCPQKYLYMT